MQANEIERARSALFHLSPDMPRPEWVRTGMAAHAAGLTAKDWDEWCQPGQTYNRAAARDTWRSFKNGQGGITAGALFGMARDAGWRDDAPERALPTRPPVAATKPQATQRQPLKGHSAAEVWGRALPADVSHPYIFKKQAAGVPLENLRVLPENDSLRITGKSMSGALVVPARSIDGELKSCVLITPQGEKMNLPGSPISGALHVVGELARGAVVYIAEGLATAWACWQATGNAAVCAFGWGNVRRVVEALRQQDESARIVLVPDTGKEKDAAKVAGEFGCTVAAMPDGWAANSDVSDLMREAGPDVLQELLESAVAPTSDASPSDSPPAPGIKLVSVCDVFTNPSPPPAFVWGELVPRGEVTVFAAHGGVGKSTVALMLCDAVATGMPLFGIPTQQARALFVSAEDGAPIVRHRLAAIARGRGANPADWGDALQAVDITDCPELYESDGRSAGATTAVFADIAGLLRGGGFGLVVIDNASDAYGGDEIQRRPVRTFLRHLKQLASENNCAVLLLVHVDKATSRNKGATGGEAYSGSTAWHNTARSRLFLSRDDSGMLKLEHLKSNLGRKQEPLTLQWPDGGLPMRAEGGAVDFSGLMTQAQGRNDDNAAAALLKLIAEFESRGQFAAPAPQARNNVHALLRSEPAFKALGLTQDDTKRIVNQCQRAGWIAQLEYRTSDRKNRERWTVTEAGRAFSGLFAPTAPTAPTY